MADQFSEGIFYTNPITENFVSTEKMTGIVDTTAVKLRNLSLTLPEKLSFAQNNVIDKELDLSGYQTGTLLFGDADSSIIKVGDQQISARYVTGDWRFNDALDSQSTLESNKKSAASTGAQRTWISQLYNKPYYQVTPEEWANAKAYQETEIWGSLMRPDYQFSKFDPAQNYVARRAQIIQENPNGVEIKFKSFGKDAYGRDLVDLVNVNGTVSAIQQAASNPYLNTSYNAADYIESNTNTRKSRQYNLDTDSLTALEKFYGKLGDTGSKGMLAQTGNMAVSAVRNFINNLSVAALETDEFADRFSREVNLIGDPAKEQSIGDYISSGIQTALLGPAKVYGALYRMFSSDDGYGLYEYLRLTNHPAFRNVINDGLSGVSNKVRQQYQKELRESGEDWEAGRYGEALKKIASNMLYLFADSSAEMGSIWANNIALSRLNKVFGGKPTFSKLGKYGGPLGSTIQLMASVIPAALNQSLIAREDYEIRNGEQMSESRMAGLFAGNIALLLPETFVLGINNLAGAAMPTALRKAFNTAVENMTPAKKVMLNAINRFIGSAAIEGVQETSQDLFNRWMSNKELSWETFKAEWEDPMTTTSFLAGSAMGAGMSGIASTVNVPLDIVAQRRMNRIRQSYGEEMSRTVSGEEAVIDPDDTSFQELMNTSTGELTNTNITVEEGTNLDEETSTEEDSELINEQNLNENQTQEVSSETGTESSQEVSEESTTKPSNDGSSNINDVINKEDTSTLDTTNLEESTDPSKQGSSEGISQEDTSPLASSSRTRPDKEMTRKERLLLDNFFRDNEKAQKDHVDRILQAEFWLYENSNKRSIDDVNSVEAIRLEHIVSLFKMAKDSETKNALAKKFNMTAQEILEAARFFSDARAQKKFAETGKALTQEQQKASKKQLEQVGKAVGLNKAQVQSVITRNRPNFADGANGYRSIYNTLVQNYARLNDKNAKLTNQQRQRMHGQNIWYIQRLLYGQDRLTKVLEKASDIIGKLADGREHGDHTVIFPASIDSTAAIVVRKLAGNENRTGFLINKAILNQGDIASNLGIYSTLNAISTDIVNIGKILNSLNQKDVSAALNAWNNSPSTKKTPSRAIVPVNQEQLAQLMKTVKNASYLIRKQADTEVDTSKVTDRQISAAIATLLNKDLAEVKRSKALTLLRSLPKTKLEALKESINKRHESKEWKSKRLGIVDRALGLQERTTSETAERAKEKENLFSKTESWMKTLRETFEKKPLDKYEKKDLASLQKTFSHLSRGYNLMRNYSQSELSEDKNNLVEAYRKLAVDVFARYNELEGRVKKEDIDKAVALANKNKTVPLTLTRRQAVESQVRNKAVAETNRLIRRANKAQQRATQQQQRATQQRATQQRNVQQRTAQQRGKAQPRVEELPVNENLHYQETVEGKTNREASLKKIGENVSIATEGLFDSKDGVVWNTGKGSGIGALSPLYYVRHDGIRLEGNKYQFRNVYQALAHYLAPTEADAKALMSKEYEVQANKEKGIQSGARKAFVKYREFLESGKVDEAKLAKVPDLLLDFARQIFINGDPSQYNAKQLLGTRNAEIVYNSDYEVIGDTALGKSVRSGEGYNAWGKALMQVRKELRDTVQQQAEAAQEQQAQEQQQEQVQEQVQEKKIDEKQQNILQQLEELANNAGKPRPKTERQEEQVQESTKQVAEPGPELGTETAAEEAVEPQVFGEESSFDDLSAEDFAELYGEQTAEPATEPSTEQVTEQTIEQATEQVTEPASETAPSGETTSSTERTAEPAPSQEIDLSEDPLMEESTSDLVKYLIDGSDLDTEQVSQVYEEAVQEETTTQTEEIVSAENETLSEKAAEKITESIGKLQESVKSMIERADLEASDVIDSTHIFNEMEKTVMGIKNSFYDRLSEVEKLWNEVKADIVLDNFVPAKVNYNGQMVDLAFDGANFRKTFTKRRLAYSTLAWDTNAYNERFTFKSIGKTIPLINFVRGKFSEIALDFYDLGYSETSNSNITSPFAFLSKVNKTTGYSVMDKAAHYQLLYDIIRTDRNGNYNPEGKFVKFIPKDQALKAMDLAVRQYFSERITGKTFDPRSPEEQLAKFGIDIHGATNTQTVEVREFIKNFGVPITQDAAKIGRTMLRIMGITTNPDYALMNQMENLASGLGLEAFKYAEALGMITLHYYQSQRDNRVIGKTKDGKPIHKFTEIGKGSFMTAKMTKQNKTMVERSNEFYKKNLRDKYFLDMGIENGPMTRPISRRYIRQLSLDENTISVDGRAIRHMYGYGVAPEFTEQVMQRYERMPFTFNAELFSMLESIGLEKVATRLGWSKMEDINEMSYDGAASAEGVNRSITDQLVNLFGYGLISKEYKKDTGKDLELYFNMFMSSNGRAFLDSVTLNPQTSKALARFVVMPKAAYKVFNRTLPDHIEAEKFAIAQAFDSLGTQSSIDALHENMLKLNVDELRTMFTDLWEMGEKAFEKKYSHLGIKGIENMGEASNALDHLIRRQMSEGKLFKTWLVVENDATTSGYFIREKQMPLASIITRYDSRVGSFEIEDGGIKNLFTKEELANFGIDNVNDLTIHEVKKMKGFTDIYQTMALETAEKFKTFGDIAQFIPNLIAIGKLDRSDNWQGWKWFTTEPKFIEHAYEALFETLPKPNPDGTVSKALRTLLKAPAMVFGYGAGTLSIIRNTVNEIQTGTIDDYMNFQAWLGRNGYEKLKGKHGFQMTAEERDTVRAAIKKYGEDTGADANRIYYIMKFIDRIGKYNLDKHKSIYKSIKEKSTSEILFGIQGKTNKGKNALKQFTLDDIFFGTIAPTYGQSITEALKEHFEDYVDINKKMIQATVTIAELGQRVYNKKYKDFLEANKGKRITERMFQQFMKEMRPYMPTINLAYQRLNDSITGLSTDGTMLIAGLEKQSDNDTQILGLSRKLRDKETGQYYLQQETIYPESYRLSNPGVSAIVKGIHFLDGMQMAMTMNRHLEKGIIPVHDAIVMSALDAAEITRDYNMFGYMLGQEYNQPAEILASLWRMRTIASEVLGMSEKLLDAWPVHKSSWTREITKADFDEDIFKKTGDVIIKPGFYKSYEDKEGADIRIVPKYFRLREVIADTIETVNTIQYWRNNYYYDNNNTHIIANMDGPRGSAFVKEGGYQSMYDYFLKDMLNSIMMYDRQGTGFDSLPRAERDVLIDKIIGKQESLDGNGDATDTITRNEAEKLIKALFAKGIDALLGKRIAPQGYQGRDENGNITILHSSPYAWTSESQVETLRSELTTNPSLRKEVLEELHRLDTSTGKQTISDNHLKHLTKLVTTLSPKRLNDFATQIRTSDTEQHHSAQISTLPNKAIQVNISKSALNNFNINSAAEAYAHELTHAASLFVLQTQNLFENKNIVRQLQHIYDRAAQTITWEAFMPVDYDPSMQSTYEQEAKTIWNYIFNPTYDAEQRNSMHGLAEFIAYGMTNEKFMNALNEVKVNKQIDIIAEMKGKAKLADKFITLVSWVFNKIFGNRLFQSDAFSKVFKNTPFNTRNTLYQALDALMYQINEIDMKHTGYIKERQAFRPVEAALKFFSVIHGKGNQFLVPMVRAVTEFGDRHPAFTEKVLRSNPAGKIHASKISHVKFLATVLLPLLTSKKVRREFFKYLKVMLRATHHNVITGFLEDMGTPDGDTISFEMKAFYARMVEASAKMHESIVSNDLTKAFTKELTPMERNVLGRVGLQLDLQSLLTEEGGLARVKEMITNADARKARITEITDHFIKKYKGANRELYYHMNQAKGLAIYMLTGDGNEAQMLNAYNIYHRFFDAVSRKDTNTKEQRETEIAMIDELATLYALEYGRQNTEVSSMLDGFVGMEEKGVLNFLKMHQMFVEDSRSNPNGQVDPDFSKAIENNFSERVGVPATHMQKGYTKQLFDTGTDMTVMPLRFQEELKKQGYQLVSKIKSNKIWPQELGYFKRIYKSFNRRDSSAFMFNGYGAMGQTLQDAAYMEISEFNPNRDKVPDGWFKSAYAHMLGKANELAKNIDRAYLFKEDINFNIIRNMSTGAIPIMNGVNFNVGSNYRFIMNKQAKREHLKMDEDGIRVLSKMFGSQMLDSYAPVVNESIVDYLFTDMEQNMILDAKINKYTNEKYVPISKTKEWREMPQSIREYVGLALSKLNRQYAQTVTTGEYIYNDLYVRESWLLDIFGTPQMSMIDTRPFKSTSPTVKKFVTNMEGVIRSIASIAKGNIVVKTPTVLFGNVISNLAYSVMNGHNPVKVMKLSWDNARALRQYINDRKEFNRIQMKTKLGTATQEEINSVHRIRSRMENNIVAPLVKMGFYQTIVEDLSAKDLDAMSTFYQVLNSPKFGKLGDKTKKVLSHIYLGEGTPFFDFMYTLTQYSDFVARATEYQLQMAKAPARYNSDGSLNIAYDIHEKQVLRNILMAFVNYNRPQTKGEQYANDMGLFMFTKFAKRIQRVIAQTVQGNPMGAIMFLLGNHYVVDADNILEQNVISKHWSNLFYSPIDNVLNAMIPQPAKWMFGDGF